MKKAPTLWRLLIAAFALASGASYAIAQSGGGSTDAQAARLQKACDGGAAGDCFLLGSMFDRGGDVPRDPGRAAGLYQKACEGGNGLACNNLGRLYQNGDGVPKDLQRAASLYKKACEGGNPQGCNSLKALQRRLGTSAAEGSRGNASKREGATESAQQRCDGGDATSCYNLGRQYSRKDPALAAGLFQKACDGGEVLGCNSLGFLYAQGEGVPKDFAHAAGLFQKACDGGTEGSMGSLQGGIRRVNSGAQGCYNLGSAYEHGEGVPKDLARAVSLYQKACDGGDEHSCNYEGILHEKGQGTPKDVAGAASLYQKACDLGDAEGCYNLGLLYEKGRGVPKDPARAKGLYRKACEGGVAQACDK